MILYLVRHGESLLNEKGLYYGWTDCGLSSRGYKQAKRLAGELKDISFDAVISSPLKRALDTAVIVSGRTSKDIILDERQKEINFGSWEEKHYLEIQKQYPEEWKLWTADWKNAVPPGGESYIALFHRVKESLDDICTRYEKKNILLVSHHGCLRIMLSILLGMNDDGYWHFAFEPGRYTRLEISDGFCIVKKINF